MDYIMRLFEDDKMGILVIVGKQGNIINIPTYYLINGVWITTKMQRIMNGTQLLEH